MGKYLVVALVGSLLVPAFALAAQININSASAVELDTLPGIGPTKAAAIVDYRTKHGPFHTIEDIQNVTGIGPVTFANIKESITVGSVSQPTSTSAGYKQVKAVEPVNSPEISEAHDVAGLAPASAPKTAGVGAPFTPSENTPRLFSAPWTYGLVGVIILASGLFIFI